VLQQALQNTSEFDLLVNASLTNWKVAQYDQTKIIHIQELF